MSKHKVDRSPRRSRRATEPKVAAPGPDTGPHRAEIRAAGSVDAAVSILSPAKPKVNPDATYELNTSCKEPLPQKRGASIKVVAVAVQLSRTFKVEDIVRRCPTSRVPRYWTRKLVKTGHLVEVVK